ncbi:S9 family peptidase [Acidipila sp. EB88]|uniref:alpha/beta hydrolase family protein n=1 Tax=Acidipila sp. EB88 TaxID=2305226 RepID=UPI000F601940|nr:prolyl oligopeptidase family serine peptidase [Acidipila sp. EB88]RRA47167.1 S9 family peptidase [Acidipila sp. EB88]
MRFGIVGLVCIAWLTHAPLSVAQQPSPRYPDNEQLRHYRTMSEPKLSPDGRQVLFSVREATADGGKEHVWVVATEGDGEARQLTFSPDSDHNGEHGGEWMPDGQSILFLAHRGEQSALYRLPMNGGEAKVFDLKTAPTVDASRRTDAVPPAKPGAPTPADSATPEERPLGVNSFAVAPDGRMIAIVAHDPQTVGEKKEEDAKADAHWVDHDAHGDRLYLLDVASGKLAKTGVLPDVKDVAWRKDGKELLVLADEPNEQGDLKPSISAWRLAMTDLDRPMAVRDLPPTIHEATWSADGQRILYLAQAKQDAPPGFASVFEYTLATKQTRELADETRGTIGSQGPIALRGARTVQLAENGFDTTLLHFAADGAPESVKLPTPTVNSAVTNAEETGWVLLGAGGGRGPTLFYASSLAAKMQVLKTPKMMPDGVKMAPAPKRLTWTNEKLTIQGLLYLPLEAEHGKVPLVVEVHGGPLGAYADNFSPFVDFMLGQGWAVLETNPRGSTGLGAQFAAANHNDLGGADYRDIMAGVDAVLKAEPIDPDRMALLGYSYGGEMAAFVEGKTTRFKAIVSAAPVIDQQSEYGTESGSWYDRWYYGKPWEHPEDAWRQSPLSGAAHAKTPFLLLQGEADTTDPLGQAQEMYRALRQEGVPVDLVTYPRENHGPLSVGIYGMPSTEPWHGYDARQRIIAFFRKYLK